VGRSLCESSAAVSVVDFRPGGCGFDPGATFFAEYAGRVLILRDAYRSNHVTHAKPKTKMKCDADENMKNLRHRLE